MNGISSYRSVSNLMPGRILQPVLIFAAMCFCVSAAGTETVFLASHTFTIEDGYELKQVAAPPLVKRPIHMCFDANGVLYVTDSSGNTEKATVQLKDLL